ncbi:hypothetical protein NDU88_003837 [Pleurodeles waltl]|uniref:Uncharacterized protein n=1 Tax=Pleurodeles waltl TaxID=8319 RepID=A0AAV7TSE5_PLEWA|nr:hypothetical protein NDU88_003837 [Pleurodeles waltl]
MQSTAGCRNPGRGDSGEATEAQGPLERSSYLVLIRSAAAVPWIRARRDRRREPVDPWLASEEEACLEGGVALLRRRSRLGGGSGDRGGGPQRPFNTLGSQSPAGVSVGALADLQNAAQRG